MTNYTLVKLRGVKSMVETLRSLVPTITWQDEPKYFLSDKEIEIIETFNRSVPKEIQIQDFDIIGWAGEILEQYWRDRPVSKQFKPRKQKPHLLWVPSKVQKHEGRNQGRLSRTLLELVALVHGKAILELANALSVSNYSITKSVKRGEQHYEPFFPISFVDNKIVTLGIKIPEENPVALDFYLPRKFLDPLIDQYRETGEKIAFIKKDNEFPTLEGLGLFDNSQKTPTEIANVLLIALQRWWLMEYAILDTAIIAQLITTELIPLPAALYAFAMANKEVMISRLTNLYQTFEEDIVDQVKGILSTTYEIPTRLKDEQVLIPITVSNRLLKIESEHDVYTWLKQSGFIFPLEFEKALVPLYQETIEEIINDVNKNSNLGLKPNISINCFVGEGKTGVLGQLILKLLKEERSIYILQGGMVTGVFPSDAIFIIDNLHKLDSESLKVIQRLQTHGYQIIFSQSKELAYTLATKFENLKLAHAFRTKYIDLPSLTVEEINLLISFFLEPWIEELSKDTLDPLTLFTKTPRTIAQLYSFLCVTRQKILTPTFIGLFMKVQPLYDIAKVVSLAFISEKMSIDQMRAECCILSALGVIGSINRAHLDYLEKLVYEKYNVEHLWFYKTFTHIRSNAVTIGGGLLSDFFKAPEEILSLLKINDFVERIPSLEIDLVLELIERLKEGRKIVRSGIIQQGLKNYLANQSPKEGFLLIPYVLKSISFIEPTSTVISEYLSIVTTKKRLKRVNKQLHDDSLAEFFGGVNNLITTQMTYGERLSDAIQLCEFFLEVIENFDLKTTRFKEAKGTLLLNQTRFLVDTGKFGLAYKKLHLTLQYCRKNGFVNWEANIFNRLARLDMHFSPLLLVRAKKLLRKSIARIHNVETTGADEVETIALNITAHIHLMERNIEMAKKTCKKALEFAKRINRPQSIGFAQWIEAMTEWIDPNGNKEVVIEKLLRSLITFERYGQYAKATQFRWLLPVILISQDEIDRADEIIKDMNKRFARHYEGLMVKDFSIPLSLLSSEAMPGSSGLTYHYIWANHPRSQQRDAIESYPIFLEEFKKLKIKYSELQSSLSTLYMTEHLGVHAAALGYSQAEEFLQKAISAKFSRPMFQGVSILFKSLGDYYHGIEKFQRVLDCWTLAHIFWEIDNGPIETFIDRNLIQLLSDHPALQCSFLGIKTNIQNNIINIEIPPDAVERLTSIKEWPTPEWFSDWPDESEILFSDDYRREWISDYIESYENISFSQFFEQVYSPERKEIDLSRLEVPILAEIKLPKLPVVVTETQFKQFERTCAMCGAKHSTTVELELHTRWCPQKQIALKFISEGNLQEHTGNDIGSIIKHWKVAKIYGRDQMGWIGLALNYDRLGANDYAASLFIQALYHNPENYEVWFDLGNSLYKMGERDAAFASWEHILTSRPDDLDTLLRLGYAHLENGDLDTAENKAKRALNLDPDNTRAIHLIAQIYLCKRNFCSATEKLTAIESEFSDDPFYWFERLVLHWNEKNWFEAEESCEKILEFVQQIIKNLNNYFTFKTENLSLNNEEKAVLGVKIHLERARYFFQEKIMDHSFWEHQQVEKLLKICKKRLKAKIPFKEAIRPLILNYDIKKDENPIELLSIINHPLSWLKLAIVHLSIEDWKSVRFFIHKAELEWPELIDFRLDATEDLRSYLTGIYERYDKKTPPKATEEWFNLALYKKSKDDLKNMAVCFQNTFRVVKFWLHHLENIREEKEQMKEKLSLNFGTWAKMGDLALGANEWIIAKFCFKQLEAIFMSRVAMSDINLPQLNEYEYQYFPRFESL